MAEWAGATCALTRGGGNGTKALSLACGCAGRILALRAQKDITPRGEALWKQQRSMRLMSMSLSSMNGLTKSVSVLRLLPKEGVGPRGGPHGLPPFTPPPLLLLHPPPP